ncbi:MAG: hypothetical protein GXY18_14920, partial [Methanomicrobiales archaeon]|nr:hypothetical protein [Methanomicrobiales archaeon]
DTLLAYASDLIRERARSEGAPEDDIQDVQVHFFSAYDVVKGWRITARITDIILGIAPGISMEAL